MKKESLEETLQKLFDDQTLIQAIFSAPIKKDAKISSRVDIRPIQAKNGVVYQVSEQIGPQAFHRNLGGVECQKLMLEELSHSFQQAILFTTHDDIHLTMNQGAVKIRRKSASKQLNIVGAHNRKKNYVIEANTPVPYLAALGIMNAQGNVHPQKMPKYRQINRFLEMVADILPHLQTDKTLRVIDFGCGKAYLTFSLYDYLTRIRGLDVQMVGLDLKETVIQSCQQLTEQLEFKGLRFQLGDIADHQPKDTIDLVIALHACDTATDAALAVAVRWQAKVILAAPCCQHELNHQVKCQPLQALLQYGLLKERFAALSTDAVRACLLEASGYQTQILEFIDSEHTPKNLLIRAVKGNTTHQREQAVMHFAEIKDCLGIHPSLEKMLKV